MSVASAKLGTRVRVVLLTDMHIYGEDVAAKKRFKSFHNQVGQIVRIDNTECGATPKDPMFIVEFRSKECDAFWTEELELVP